MDARIAARMPGGPRVRGAGCCLLSTRPKLLSPLLPHGLLPVREGAEVRVAVAHGVARACLTRGGPCLSDTGRPVPVVREVSR